MTVGPHGLHTANPALSAYIAEQEEVVAAQTVAVLQAQLGVMRRQLAVALDGEEGGGRLPRLQDVVDPKRT